MTGTSALPLLAVPARDLDETYIGTKALIPLAGGTALVGGISDVYAAAANEPVVIPGFISICALRTVLVWIGGAVVRLALADLVMTDPSSTALAAMDAPA